MNNLHELDELIDEFKNEVALTKSVNQLATHLQDESKQQANKLREAQEQLAATSIHLKDTTQQLSEISVKSASSTKEQLDNFDKQQNEAYKQFSKQVDARLDELRSQQNKHFVELSSSLEVRLDNHRSAIRQIIESESAKLSETLTEQVDVLSTTVQSQGKTMTELWYMAVAQIVIILLLILAKLARWL